MPPVPSDLIRRYETAGPRYTSYPTVPSWNRDFGEREYRDALADAADDGAPLALYVHLPYCAAKCFYCACNAVVTSRPEVMERYLDDLEREIELVVESLGAQRAVAQMHWGGGTPNLLSDHQLARVFEMFSRNFSFATNAEISIEADPRQASRSQLMWLRRLGFTRISFGVQDLDPVVQQAIGRVQSWSMVRDVCDGARAAGFDELNLDIIYGLPHQTRESFLRTVVAVLAVDPDRIACFGYAHLPAQRGNQRLISDADLPNTEVRFELLALAGDAFRAAGYAWIGLDHFARQDDPLAIAQRGGMLHRNFMGYTTMPGQHLVGFGASAISEAAGRFAQNAAKVGEWRDAIEAGRLPIVRGHVLTDDDRVRGDAIRALMCNLELPFLDSTAALHESVGRLGRYVDDGLVVFEPDRVRVTDLGRFFLRNLCMEFDAYLPDQEITRFSSTV